MKTTVPKISSEKSELKTEWYQIGVILLACVTSLTAGQLFSWSSPSIPKLIEDKENYDIDIEAASYLTVIPPIGIICACFFYSKLIDIFGRKWLLWSVSVPYLISWILIAVAKSPWVFYVSRFLTGIADAGLFSVLPVYIGEIASPKIRGTWGNCITLLIYLGQFLINVIGSYTSIPNTAYICMCVPIFFLATFHFMPESPFFYVMKGKYEEAKTTLQKLKGKEDVDEELEQLKKDVNRQLSERGTWKELFFISSNRKALFAGIFLRTSQQLGGISTFAVYTQYIFLRAGGSLSASTSAIIFTALCTVLNFTAAFTLDRIGKRRSYFYSCLFCGIVLGFECAYFFVDQFYGDQIDLTPYKWIPIVGMIAFVIFYSFGLGIVPTLMLGELFSASVKGKGLCVLNIVFGLLISAVTKLFQVLETNIGLYAPFLLFAVTCLISCTMSFYFVPETRGKSLEEIQQSLKTVKRERVTEDC